MHFNTRREEVVHDDQPDVLLVGLEEGGGGRSLDSGDWGHVGHQHCTPDSSTVGGCTIVQSSTSSQPERNKQNK